eukprot:GHRR01007118.1.p2 GENE.GHRR01007118.1~~GHRR01007118.1.p2  ORF type:complete len:156 (+),score=30.78 GHRR01007118.1:924-1391(+)
MSCTWMAHPLFLKGSATAGTSETEQSTGTRYYWSLVSRMGKRKALQLAATTLVNKDEGRRMAIEEVNQGGLEMLYRILLEDSPGEWVAALRHIRGRHDSCQCSEITTAHCSSAALLPSTVCQSLAGCFLLRLVLPGYYKKSASRCYMPLFCCTAV